MKIVKLYEFKDLTKEVQEKVRCQEVDELVRFSLEMLSQDDITEEQYYKAIGCSKSYAESTSWFIPQCYYDNHKKEVDEEVEEIINKGLYTEYGLFVMNQK